ncbi:MAG: type III pantothenate kinase [Phycisphaerales bacterium]
MAAKIIAVMVGNTNTLAGRFDLADPTKTDAGPVRISNLDPDALTGALDELGASEHTVVIAGNNPEIEAGVAHRIREDGRTVRRIGVDVGIELRHTLDPDTRTGQDRLLAACGAWAVKQQACVVIDAGTAITVDFVDGEGVFQGGAIAPGARMSLSALHRGAPALPEVELRAPLEDPFGRNTTQAILNGVFYGIRGMVRALAERYALAYEAYPAIIATGGDAELLFSGDELIEHIRPDLTLVGIAVSCAAAIEDMA